VASGGQPQVARVASAKCEVRSSQQPAASSQLAIGPRDDGTLVAGPRDDGMLAAGPQHPAAK
jgi:hypothetical protein